MSSNVVALLKMTVYQNANRETIEGIKYWLVII